MTQTLDILQVIVCNLVCFRKVLLEMLTVQPAVEWFFCFVNFVQDYLELRKYSYERLDGSIRAEERFAAIRSFSHQSVNNRSKFEAEQNAAFVFLISTRAGGVGLNLVAADTVSENYYPNFYYRIGLRLQTWVNPYIVQVFLSQIYVVQVRSAHSSTFSPLGIWKEVILSYRHLRSYAEVKL